MKKKTILACAAVVAGSLISFEALTFTGGAPQGRNGSMVSQGVTCAASGCHTNGPSVSTQTITITSDIPAGGFITNTDYNFTVTLDDGGTSSSKVGFGASVEDGSGHVGSLTAGTGNQKTGSFLTHTSSGTVMAGGSRDYTFTWNSGNAPDGTVVYIAANFSNSNNGFTGDVIATETLTLTKGSGVSLTENKVAQLQLSPNPAVSSVNLSQANPETKAIEIYSLDGRLVKAFGEDFKTSANEWNLTLDGISNGTYLVVPMGEGLGQASKLVISK